MNPFVEPHGHSPLHPSLRPSGATSRPNAGAFIHGHSPWPSAAGVIKRITRYHLLLIVFSILSSFSTSSGYEFWDYSWPVSSIPVQYRISNSVPSAFRDDIERGFSSWNNIEGSYFNAYRGSDDSGNTVGNDGINRICWFTSGWSYGSSAIAITVLSGSTRNQFTDVDLAFNNQHFDFGNVDGSPCISPFYFFDVENIAAHEAGHFVGLSDLYKNGDTEKTMYGYASTCETKKRTLEIDDLNGIITLYPTVLESVSDPDTPSGPASGYPGTSYTYTTGGSSSNLGHSVKYRFDWGDGTNSGWLPVGQTFAPSPGPRLALIVSEFKPDVRLTPLSYQVSL